jgi:hypothetical protein
VLRSTLKGRIAPALALAVLTTVLVFAAPARAAFPGANGKIAFSFNAGGNFEIYSMNPDGTGQTNLTNNAAGDTRPAWSPDGAKIAFVRNEHLNDDIYVMNADGTGQTSLTNQEGFDTNPAWSPDGTKIVFESDRSGPAEIYTMNADGTSVTRLRSGFVPAWSPDGTKIAFSMLRNDNIDIYTMNVDGSRLTRLTEDAASDWAPNWSPNGAKITFASYRDHPLAEIYTMSADGSQEARLTHNEATDFGPAWSPDGTKIAFWSDQEGPCCRNVEIYTVNADGSGQVRLTNNFAVDADPDWQPVPIQPPDCSRVTATPHLLWPPNRKLRLVTLAGAGDPGGGALTVRVDGVSQDEPLTGRGDKTSPDASSGTAPNQVRLRSERNQDQDGRVYRIAFTGEDERGGTCSGVAKVSVPRRKKDPAVDSAPPSYNSFGT